MELQGRLADIRKAGMGLAAISYDPVPVLADFSRRRGITFPLLSDAGSETIKRYGILNTTIDPGNQLYGYPFPGTFIVDRHGSVTSRFFEEAYQERDTVSSILVRLGRHVDAHATRITGAHVTLTLRLQPGVVVKAAQFPKAEDYFFKPLNEHVLVYQHPFRIVQDVMIDPSTAGTAALKDVTTLTIAGTFEYQACDDKVCFLPQSVPLSWTIGVKPLDRERAKQP